MSALECGQGKACGLYLDHARAVAQIILKAAGVIELRQQHHLKQARRIEQEIGAAKLFQSLFNRNQCAREPVAIPYIDFVLRLAILRFEKFEHRQRD